MQMFDTMTQDLLSPVKPVELVKPINPVEPVQPVDPSKPANSVNPPSNPVNRKPITPRHSIHANNTSLVNDSIASDDGWGSDSEPEGNNYNYAITLLL